MIPALVSAGLLVVLGTVLGIYWTSAAKRSKAQVSTPSVERPTEPNLPSPATAETAAPEKAEREGPPVIAKVADTGRKVKAAAGDSHPAKAPIISSTVDEESHASPEQKEICEKLEYDDRKCSNSDWVKHCIQNSFSAESCSKDLALERLKCRAKGKTLQDCLEIW